MLQQDYTMLDHRFQHRMGPIKNIVVSFGAVDQFDLTGKTIEACLELKGQKFQRKCGWSHE